MSNSTHSLFYSSIAALSIVAACSKGPAPAPGAGGGGRGAAPPAAVKILTLQEKPLEQSSDFIASLRSLHASTIQPEVEGVVTRIFVKAGDRVRPGTPLVQINPEKQRASVASTEATRAGTEADVQVPGASR